jgi:membrane fusion protein, macrolide-specific efflux system
MSKRKISIWLVIIATIAFGGYEWATSKKAATTYTTENVAHGDLLQTVSATGEVASLQELELAFSLTGRADSVLADVGDKVVKGQRLATIDRSTFPQQLRQAELDIKIQKETLRNMKRNRNEDVYSKNQRNAQESVIKKSQEAYSSVLRQMRDNSLYAPASGMIIKRSIDVGETAMASKTAFILADPDNLLLESNIPEADIVDVSVGQKVSVTFDALTDDDIFSGQVTEVDPASTVIQDVVYYRVKIKLDNFDKRLKIGMTCNDDIVTAEAHDILMIPQRAVKKENSKRYVEILHETEEKQEVEKRYVETGISGDNGMIEIKKGLKEGEKVITFTKTQ